VAEVAAIVGIMEERFDQDTIFSDQVSSAAIVHDGLPVIAFETREALRGWLQREHARSSGIWVQLARSGAPLCSISFHDLLEEGLCFGWSESTRHRGDTQTFLQKFTPRRTRGTKSERNKRLFEMLQAQGLMKSAGEVAMGNVRR
jgi:uncharacterized protein YdeI (YjbR/CyaY-like superfamily)